MLIQSTQAGRQAEGFSRLERAVIDHSIEPVNMLSLVESCRQTRATQFPPRRIAELVTKMEAHGYVTITK